MTGRLERATVGVEDVTNNGREFRGLSDDDVEAQVAAEHYLEDHKASLVLPEGEISPDHRDVRPENYGLTAFRDMFSARQLSVLGTAFAWVSKCDEQPAVRAALGLAVSNALASNNRMCGYATDYGRLSALFSVRGYSLPALSVELNPLHPTGGRGTLSRTLARVASSSNERVRRHVWDVSRGDTTPVEHRHHAARESTTILGTAVSASRADLGRSGEFASAVLTDPPYFDYISYDRLSSFYRAWMPIENVEGVSLHPSQDDPVGSFAHGLGSAFAQAACIVGSGPIVFTYHSADRRAWESVGLALDRAKLVVTAMWPVLADPRMGHHGTAGACEYDLVIVTRRAVERDIPTPTFIASTVEEWLDELGLVNVGQADVTSIGHAIDMATHRTARRAA